LCKRKLCITASIIKEVCHHRPTTNCEVFIKRKLSCDPIDVTAIFFFSTVGLQLPSLFIGKSMESLSKWNPVACLLTIVALG